MEILAHLVVILFPLAIIYMFFWDDIEHFFSSRGFSEFRVVERLSEYGNTFYVIQTKLTFLPEFFWKDISQSSYDSKERAINLRNNFNNISKNKRLISKTKDKVVE